MGGVRFAVGVVAAVFLFLHHAQAGPGGDAMAARGARARDSEGEGVHVRVDSAQVAGAHLQGAPAAGADPCVAHTDCATCVAAEPTGEHGQYVVGPDGSSHTVTPYCAWCATWSTCATTFVRWNVTEPPAALPVGADVGVPDTAVSLARRLRATDSGAASMDPLSPRRRRLPSTTCPDAGCERIGEGNPFCLASQFQPSVPEHTAGCEQFGDCASCIGTSGGNTSCAWCASQQRCLDLSGNILSPPPAQPGEAPPPGTCGSTTCEAGPLYARYLGTEAADVCPAPRLRCDNFTSFDACHSPEANGACVWCQPTVTGAATPRADTCVPALGLEPASPSLCPAATSCVVHMQCERATTCSECSALHNDTVPGGACGWCEATQRCLPATSQAVSGDDCGVGSCSQPHCFRVGQQVGVPNPTCRATSPHLAASCESHTNCKECHKDETQACGWCIATGKCVTMGLGLPCDGTAAGPCADGSGLITAVSGVRVGNLGGSQYDLCPAETHHCSEFNTSETCLAGVGSRACVWCGHPRTQSVVHATASASVNGVEPGSHALMIVADASTSPSPEFGACLPASGAAPAVPGSCAGGCLKAAPEAECDVYTTCSACAAANALGRAMCGWCAVSHKCLPILTNPMAQALPSGDGGGCGSCDGAGPWKCLRTRGADSAPLGTDARTALVTSESYCPTAPHAACSDLSARGCAACVASSPGCAWCAVTEACVEASGVVLHRNISSAGAQHPAPQLCTPDQCPGAAEPSNTCVHARFHPWDDPGRAVPAWTLSRQCPSNPQSRCSAFSDCHSCATDAACGWCGLTSACVPITLDGKPCANDTDVAVALAGAPAMNCPACALVTASTLDYCPPPNSTCAAQTDCASCTGASDACTWCTHSKTCVIGSINGGGSCGGSEQGTCNGCRLSGRAARGQCDTPSSQTHCCLYDGTTCSGRGQCGTAGCECNTPWGGTFCTACPYNDSAVGYWGDDCASCPHDDAFPFQCSAHGSCGTGRRGDGICHCVSGWTGPACAQCKGAKGAPGWNADCTDCDNDHYGPTCGRACNCSIGTCAVGRKGTGQCTCTLVATATSVPAACNGRGACNASTGHCTCTATGAYGELCVHDGVDEGVVASVVISVCLVVLVALGTRCAWRSTLEARVRFKSLGKVATKRAAVDDDEQNVGRRDRLEFNFWNVWTAVTLVAKGLQLIALCFERSVPWATAAKGTATGLRAMLVDVEGQLFHELFVGAVVYEACAVVAVLPHFVTVAVGTSRGSRGRVSLVRWCYGDTTPASELAAGATSGGRARGGTDEDDGGGYVAMGSDDEGDNEAAADASADDSSSGLGGGASKGARTGRRQTSAKHHPLSWLLTPLPLFIDTLGLMWIPVVRRNFTGLACTYTAVGKPPMLDAVPGVVCWSQAHLPYILPAAFAMCLFVPLVLRVLPPLKTQTSTASSKQISFDPLYQLVQMQLHVVTAAVATFLSSVAAANVTTVLTTTVVQLAFSVKMQPCRVPSVNQWNNVLLLCVVAVAAGGIVSLVVNDPSNFWPFLGTGAALAVLLGAMTAFAGGCLTSPAKANIKAAKRLTMGAERERTESRLELRRGSRVDRGERVGDRSPAPSQHGDGPD